MSEDFLRYCIYYQEYLHFLRSYSNYERSSVSEEERFLYDFSSVHLKKLEETYQALELVKDSKSDLDIILKLMRWVYEKLLYRESYEQNISHLHAADILDIAKAERKSVNCLSHATVMTEVLLLYHFFAKTVTCLSMGTFPYDCHNITVVYVPSIKQWIALDPTFNFYFTDQREQLISLDAMRRACIDNKDIRIISNHRFQSSQTKELQSIYMKYMAKNLFRFRTYKNVMQRRQDREEEIIYELVPKGYMPNAGNYIFKESENRSIYYISDPDFFWEKQIREDRDYGV